MKKFDKAIKSFQKCIEIDPTKSEFWYINIATSFISLKKNREAILATEKAIELNPNNSLVYTNKSLLLVDLNKYEEAIECLDKAIALNSIMH